MSNRIIHLCLAALLLLTACHAKPESQMPSLVTEEPPWRSADLRQIKAPGHQAPSQTLVALYTREIDTELQIRLDLLDFSPDPNFDLYLALDTQPGGTRNLPIYAQSAIDWDVLISIPASGAVQALNSTGQEVPGLKLRVVEDAFQDSVVVSLDRFALGVDRGGFKLQVFLTASKTKKLADSLGPVRSDAIPPQPAPLLLAFWNTFPATSPAQALRDWNGAHTGPFGGRHGLVNLLRAAWSNKVPLTLVDIKTPGGLSALDTIDGGINLLHTLISGNLLSLPDVLPVEPAWAGSLLKPADWAIQRILDDGRLSAVSFHLPAATSLYSPLSPAELPPARLAGYNLLFMADPAQNLSSGITLLCQRFQSWLVLPLPTGLQSDLSAAQVATSQQIDLNGLSLDARRTLLTLAAQNRTSGADANSPCTGQILLLGGNLAASAWGEPFMAQAAMQYIAGHPWMRALQPQDLPGTPVNQLAEAQFPPETLPASFILNSVDGKPISSGLSIDQVEAIVFKGLQSAPPGPLEQAAWQMTASLFAPGYPISPSLYPLRAEYLGQVLIWLAANRWAANPGNACAATGKNPCTYTQDVDQDGELEYILASDRYYGVFNRHGGYLTAGFAMDQNGPHQVIGPSWQFTIGRSDPSEWDPNKGLAGDPQALRGAFSEVLSGYVLPSWENYSVQAGAGTLSFISPDGRLQKTIHLTAQGLTEDYRSEGPVKVQIPLVIDPWRRFTPGWEQLYSGDTTAGQEFTWGILDGPRVRLAVRGSSLKVQPFSITRNIMGSPENPDYQFPAGHYLPFPVALVEIQAQGTFSISLKFLDK